MNRLPPDGSVVQLPAGRFRAILAKQGEQAGTAVLRGWYLDRETLTEQCITVPLAEVRVVEDG